MTRSTRLGLSAFRWKRLAAVGAVASAALLSGTAHAQEPTNGPGWAFGSWGGEIAVATVSVSALAGGTFLPQRHSRLGPDMAHPFSEGPDGWSYVTAFAAPIVLGTGAYFIEGYLRSGTGPASIDKPYAMALMPLLIEAESVALAEGMTEMLKHAVGRCRPRAWHDDKCDGASEDDFAAFPSGHTSFPSAFAGARLVFALRSEGSEVTALRWINFGLTEASAIATASLRVEAGAHSVTDVVGGWAVGHLAGIGVALMHPMLRSRGLGSIAVGPTSVTWMGSF